MNSSLNTANTQAFLDFKEPNVFSKSFSVLNELRREQKLCDVILKVDGQSFSVHRNVMASISPYFLAMFTNDMAESQMKEITINEIEPCAMESLINFAYCGMVRIDNENARSLMIGASLFLMGSVRNACADFLADQLNPMDVLGIRSFGRSMDSSYLVAISNEYICQRFSEVATSDEFVELDFEDLIEIIERDDLTVESEETTYEASMRWIKANQEERVPLLPRVLSKVRLPLLSPQFLVEKVSKEDLIRKSWPCRDLVDEAIQFHLLPERRGDFESSRTSHRISANISGKIYAVGGTDRFGVWVASVEIYDPVTNKWEMGEEEMSTKRGYHGVAALLGKLFTFGGENVDGLLQTVEILDGKTNKWSQGREMISRRRGFGVAVMNYLIYVCGGCDGATPLNSVECFCPTTDTWRRVAPMIERRKGCAAAALGGYIYVAGGGSRLHTEEKYDPAENSWVQVKSMIQKRTWFGLAALNGKLYACGGIKGNGYLKTGEVYNPRQNTWEPISPMNCKRGGLALVGNMGKLWAIGGCDGVSILSSVEVYDPVTDMWSFAPPMNVPRLGASASVFQNRRPMI